MNPIQEMKSSKFRVALLTGGGDHPYAFGLATALASRGVEIDMIGSDEIDSPEFHSTAGIHFLNLRGNTAQSASMLSKIRRILTFYAKVIGYAAAAKPKIFHILWNNRFEAFDRTLLMSYYKVLGKKLILTVHNVNTARRDSDDSFINRLTLSVQYLLADHLYVHTQKMKSELIDEFRVREERVHVVPMGINNAIPRTHIRREEARRRLGLRDGERSILFYGRIAPYKGIELLVAAFKKALANDSRYRLIIAGSLKNSEAYWRAIEESIRDQVRKGSALLKVEFIPDGETEVYFKAADVFVLPYRQVYDSGVLYLGYSFGLPVIATDVGSLRDEIIEGRTGFLARPEDVDDLACALERYFASDLYRELESRRQEIRDYVAERHSWDAVSRKTISVYAGLLRSSGSPENSYLLKDFGERRD